MSVAKLSAGSNPEGMVLCQPRRPIRMGAPATSVRTVVAQPWDASQILPVAPTGRVSRSGSGLSLTLEQTVKLRKEGE